jgi:murein L,D-transpeptidase YcbB/YkuD
MSGPFDPRNGTFGDYPAQPNKPTVMLGTWGNHARYIEGSLFWCSAQTQLYVDPIDTPCLFNAADVQALKNFQTFWGLAPDGVCGPVTFGVLDYNNALHGRY